MAIQKLIHGCPQQHYSQQPNGRNNPNVCQLMDKQNTAYPYNGILVIKRNEILIRVTTRTNHDNIILS